MSLPLLNSEDHRPDAVPAQYRQVIDMPGIDVAKASLIDARSYLKYAEFQGPLAPTKAHYCDYFEAVVLPTAPDAAQAKPRRNGGCAVKGASVHGGERVWDWGTPGPMSFCQVYLSRDLLRDVYRTMLDRDPEEGFIPAFSGSMDPRLISTLDGLRSRVRSGPSLSSLEADAWSVLISESVLSHSSDITRAEARKSAGTLSQNELSLVTQFVEDNLSEAITVEQMAQAIDMNVYSFTRRFRATMEMSPYQFVVARRLQVARSLLQSDVMPIASIAVAVGFSSQAHMTDAFKRHVGTTPGAYRASA